MISSNYLFYIFGNKGEILPNFYMKVIQNENTNRGGRVEKWTKSHNTCHLRIYPM